MIASSASSPPPPGLIPSAEQIYRRICELTQERALLRRLLRIAQANERRRDAQSNPDREKGCTNAG
jgi:hypothetical protein